MQFENAERILATIRSINGSETQHQIIEHVAKFISNYGFERIFLGQLVNPASVQLKDIMYISNWPQELQERRQKQLAILHDPIARCALNTNRPFQWAEAYEYGTRVGQHVVDMVHDYGIYDGWMFPMHAMDSITGGVSIGGKSPDVSPDDVRAIEIVAQSAYYQLQDMLGPFPYQKVASLSLRETECVQLAAAGKTNWEIASILGIQEDSIKKTLKRAYKKLDAANRAHAVAISIASGQILP